MQAGLDAPPGSGRLAAMRYSLCQPGSGLLA